MNRRRHRHRFGHHAGHDGTKRYIAKCRTCGTFTSGVTSGDMMRRLKNDPQRTGDVYTYQGPTAPGEHWTATGGNLVLDCRTCGKARNATMVRGKHNPDKKCTARCLSATGTTCECACAGKNHGGGHSA